MLLKQETGGDGRGGEERRGEERRKKEEMVTSLAGKGLPVGLV